ncbi:MAG: hypothetical protein MUF01_09170 [Bryobacterales bacterium]|jgi:hypothetical protein|nr:hypothetical protein [Bryobacterales bacterium]
MNMQFWYESAREVVDDVIESHFEALSPEAHRQLARVWQYLRDQEVKAIQTAMRRGPAVDREFSFRQSPISSMGAAD